MRARLRMCPSSPPVLQPPETPLRCIALHPVDRARNLVRHAKIAVSASLRDKCTGRIDPGSRSETLVDSQLQSERRTAKVTNGGKSTKQHVIRRFARHQV